MAEIGVLHGRFSREILEIVGPEQLHLIDPGRQVEEVVQALHLQRG